MRVYIHACVCMCVASGMRAENGDQTHKPEQRAEREGRRGNARTAGTSGLIAVFMGSSLAGRGREKVREILVFNKS